MGRLDGKVALVTGANAGQGKATAVALAKEGANVVLLCRNREKGEAALAEVRAARLGAQAELLICDLSSMKSVRAAVAEFRRKHQKLHLLINNAGVFLTTRSETPEGIETTFATNYLGHFLLTELLLPTLKASAPSRIINVASRYAGAKLDFDDLMIKKRKFSYLKAVPPTKLAQVMFTAELGERLRGTGVTVNAVHPGLVRNTQLLNEVGGMFRWMTNTFGKPVEKRIATTMRIATAPEFDRETGKLWHEEKEIKPKNQVADPGARRRLYEESVKLAGLEATRAA